MSILNISTMFAVVIFVCAMLAVHNYRKPFYQTFILCTLYCLANYFTVHYIETQNYDLDYISKIFCSLELIMAKMMYISEICTFVPEKYVKMLIDSIERSGYKDD